MILFSVLLPLKDQSVSSAQLMLSQSQNSDFNAALMHVSTFIAAARHLWKYTYSLSCREQKIYQFNMNLQPA